MKIIPITQKEARKFVYDFHRHHAPPVGCIFSIGLSIDGVLRGVAMCGRPTARRINHKEIIEVTRLCVNDNIKNGCSKLYSACARISRELGYKKIITYILEDDTGVSLKASGWECESENCGGTSWNQPSRERQNIKQDLFGVTTKYPSKMKKRFSKQLINSKTPTP